MKLQLLTMITLGTALSLGACTGSGSSTPLTTHLDDLEEHMAALESSLETHAADIQAAAMLAEMLDMEDAHAMDAQMHMGDMGMDMDHMGMCTDSHGQSLDTGAMDELMAAMMNEHDQHGMAMGAAPDMAAAGTEEGRHQAAMADLIVKMREAQTHMADHEMMDGAGTHMCSMPGE
jgi:hypothetical protein